MALRYKNVADVHVRNCVTSSSGIPRMQGPALCRLALSKCARLIVAGFMDLVLYDSSLLTMFQLLDLYGNS